MDDITYTRICNLQSGTLVPVWIVRKKKLAQEVYRETFDNDLWKHVDIYFGSDGNWYIRFTNEAPEDQIKEACAHFEVEYEGDK